jgi:hypothetical protein
MLSQLTTNSSNMGGTLPGEFRNRAALVGAEIARIEGRALDAIQLYEQAIRSARANGFVHNEALAYEVAAQFYERAASRHSPTPISGMRGTATTVGALTER